MIESGRAKYTYSKMQGVCRVQVDALLRIQATLLVDEDGLAGTHVAEQLEAQHVERDALRGQHVLAAVCAFTRADHERAYAVRIAEAENAMAQDHRHHGVGTPAAPIYRAHRREDVGRRSTRRPEALHLARQHVEQHLRVRRRVEVSQILAHEHFGELGGVREIAVVGEADAVG